MSSGKVESLGERIRAVFALGPEAIAVESGAGRSRWSDLATAAEDIEQMLRQAGIGPDMPVGWVAHNRAAAIAAFASLVMNGRMVVPLRPRQTSASFPDELAEQKLQAVIGDADDWAGEGAIAAAGKAGSFGIAVGGASSFDVRAVPELQTTLPPNAVGRDFRPGLFEGLEGVHIEQYEVHFFEGCGLLQIFRVPGA